MREQYKEFYLGTSVKIQANIAGPEPTSVTCTIRDYTGVIRVNACPMTKLNDGAYQFIWQSLTSNIKGNHYAIVTATVNGYPAIQIQQFIMMNQPGGLFR